MLYYLDESQCKEVQFYHWCMNFIGWFDRPIAILDNRRVLSVNFK